MTHIDLFTGIGGFTLACQWLGIETEVMCEKDERCKRFLERTYPRIPIWDDIKSFHGTRWQGRWLLTAGVPCQPASRAGKQRGKGDDRWLWPETLRVVAEAKPRWCLFENPPGLFDVGIDGILADLEAIGYETGIVEIPACAVNAPHIRQRVWIVAHAAKCECISRAKACGSADYFDRPSQGDMADTIATGYQGAEQRASRCNKTKNGFYPEYYQGNLADIESQLPEWAEPDRNGTDNFWSNFIWTPCADGKVRRAPDDSFSVVNGLHRSVLAALGNSIVPALAYEIIKAITKAERCLDYTTRDGCRGCERRGERKGGDAWS